MENYSAVTDQNLSTKREKKKTKKKKTEMGG